METQINKQINLSVKKIIKQEGKPPKSFHIGFAISSLILYGFLILLGIWIQKAVFVILGGASIGLLVGLIQAYSSPSNQSEKEN